MHRVPRRGTCNGVCPPATSAHDPPGPTSDDTRSGEAALPARRPDIARAAPTAPAPAPERHDAATADLQPPVHPDATAPTSPPPTRRQGDHAPTGCWSLRRRTRPPLTDGAKPDTPTIERSACRCTSSKRCSRSSAFEAMPGITPTTTARSPRSRSSPPGCSSIIRASSVAVGRRNSDHTCSMFGSVSRHRSSACAETGTRCSVAHALLCRPCLRKGCDHRIKGQRTECVGSRATLTRLERRGADISRCGYRSTNHMSVCNDRRSRVSLTAHMVRGGVHEQPSLWLFEYCSDAAIPAVNRIFAGVSRYRAKRSGGCTDLALVASSSPSASSKPCETRNADPRIPACR
jgi:hypothetical protein